MRPLHVELEGLGSFRERAELPLRDVDLFVLSGPTGAGKTTLLIDAMTLALYGTVPRYDDRRLVAPIISQGANEARVRLTFSVGSRTFTATRVVRRTKQGATTREARLEDVTGGGSTVLAGSADEVSAAVVQLVGLTFEQFCRSVILPQGAFDRFLFAKPAERADLLVQLLDLGIHDEVGRRARARAEAAKHRADAAERRLQGDLASADPQALPALVRRIGQLEDLVVRCREVGEELDELRERGAGLRVAADRAAAERDALTSLHRPDDVDALAGATRTAVAALAAAETERVAAEQALHAAEQARAQLPDAAALEHVTRAHRVLKQARGAVPELEAAAERATHAAAEAEARLGAATAAVTAARDAVTIAQRRELAHALREGLHVGDDCPVCTATVTAAPPLDPADGAATAAAREALETAERAEREAREAARTAHGAATRATTERDAARVRVTEARSELRAAVDVLDLDDPGPVDREAVDPGPADPEIRDPEAIDPEAVDLAAVDRVREQVGTADAALAAARDRSRTAATSERAARTGVEQARTRERDAWATLDRVRDSVAALSPPSLDREDLAAAWDTLLDWARDTTPTAVARADEAAAAVEQVADAWRARSGALRQACADLEVELSGAEPLEAATAALGAARAHHDRLEERVVAVREQTEERDAARAEAGVADHLGKLLRADGFERWVLARALGDLVEGASGLLRDLTSGGYSLALDPTNQFLVIDHRSADEPRTVRSLSGGERFLASLALALALADHVAQLAADGAARLESLFLDEGFGTLDPDTLDVVAAALEELGARGRVVGIVTHVRDLAERLPVRFEVRKGPGGSTVRRADDGAPGEGTAGGQAGDGQVGDGQVGDGQVGDDRAGDASGGDASGGDAPRGPDDDQVVA